MNVVRRENEKGDYVLFTYNKLNRIIEVKNNFSQKQSFEYDAMGNVIKETDAMGHVTKYNYSLGGKLISVIDAMGNRTECSYDKVGRLITVYRHEGDKKLISGVESANTSLKEPIDAVSIPRVTRYKRDLMGNIVSVINALGYEETFSYDLLGRVTGKYYSRLRGIVMKKNIIKVFIFLIIIGSIYCLYNKYNKYQMLKEIDDSVPIVFAAEFEDGNKGTFKYNIKTGEYEKISDYIFQELSYSDDYEKIIGVIWEDRFQGIAELDMRDYTFTTIINISDLNKYVKQLGLEEIKYDISGEAELRMPKYYKDGYTFFWGYYSTHICYIKPVKNTWDISIVNSGKFLCYSYFIKEEYMENKLFLETDETLMSKNEDRGTIIERIIGEDNKVGILDIELPDLLDSDGLMDMPVDMSKIAYYEEPEIYIYDLNTRKKKHVTNQCLFNQNIIELKFSPDGKYMLYTVGDNPFFGGSFYRRTFYLVDIESGNKTKLVKWRTGDMFYGIDW